MVRRRSVRGESVRRRSSAWKPAVVLALIGCAILAMLVVPVAALGTRGPPFRLDRRGRARLARGRDQQSVPRVLGRDRGHDARGVPWLCARTCDRETSALPSTRSGWSSSPCPARSIGIGLIGIWNRANAFGVCTGHPPCWCSAISRGSHRWLRSRSPRPFARFPSPTRKRQPSRRRVAAHHDPDRSTADSNRPAGGLGDLVHAGVR